MAPQGSILGPRFFKVYVHGSFLILKTTYFTGYTDGSMSFVVGDDTTIVIRNRKSLSFSVIYTMSLLSDNSKHGFTGA